MRKIHLATVVMSVLLVCVLGLGCSVSSETNPSAKKSGGASPPIMIILLDSAFYEMRTVLKTEADYKAALKELESKAERLGAYVLAHPDDEKAGMLYVSLLAIIIEIQDILSPMPVTAPATK